MPPKDNQKDRKSKKREKLVSEEPSERKLRTRKQPEREVCGIDVKKSKLNQQTRKQTKRTDKTKNVEKDTHNGICEGDHNGMSQSDMNSNRNQQNANAFQTELENDFLAQILKQKQKLNFPEISKGIINPLAERSNNMTHCLLQKMLGMRCNPLQKKSIFSPVTELVSQLKLHQTSSPFDRRCTATEWHPTNPNLVVVGSKGGDIVLQNVNDAKNVSFIKGKGPGGSVQAMKFMPNDPTKLLTASIDGTVRVYDFQDQHSQVLSDTDNFYEGPGGNISGIKFHPTKPTHIYTTAFDGKLILQDFSGKHSQVLLNTMTWDYWYCSVDLKSRSNLIATGDNTGNVLLLSLDGEQMFKHRLHKQKVTHVEFSPREDWLLCTASTDQTVQLWDVRMMKDRKSAVEILRHVKPVNSAYFSLTDGTRLLTTDQHHEIRVYQSGTWRLERTIEHPHRFFQHMTPIKAYWHPLQDLIVVGRYPDPNLPCSGKDDQRTIDILDADDGHMICQLQDPSAPGIISLTKFNHQGDTLMASMGLNILIWKRKEEIEEMRAELMSNLKKSGGNNDENGPSGTRKGRKPASKGKPSQTKTLSSKLKAKMSNM